MTDCRLLSLLTTFLSLLYLLELNLKGDFILLQNLILKSKSINDNCKQRVKGKEKIGFAS